MCQALIQLFQRVIPLREGIRIIHKVQKVRYLVNGSLKFIILNKGNHQLFYLFS